MLDVICRGREGSDRLYYAWFYPFNPLSVSRAQLVSLRMNRPCIGYHGRRNSGALRREPGAIKLMFYSLRFGAGQNTAFLALPSVRNSAFVMCAFAVRSAGFTIHNNVEI